jgi:type 1 fimbriae regulatory protein FimB/type 1 fimbriae regulatory protein FimE
MTKSQAAIRAIVRAIRDQTGNMPPMPGIFPDYPAPIVRNAPDGVRELVMARWGMPAPTSFGGPPITNIRNVKSPHWRPWLIEAAKHNRHGHRDGTMILLGYRHGFRAAELVDLRWEQIEFASATVHVRRVKQGTPSTHPLWGDELRALRRLQREQTLRSPFVFTSERGAPFSPAGFARMVERAGRRARLGFPTHPHMLRHACGFTLANQGHDTRALQAYLGHRNIQHTVKYTELAPTRFKDFWRG